MCVYVVCLPRRECVSRRRRIRMCHVIMNRGLGTHGHTHTHTFEAGHTPPLTRPYDKMSVVACLPRREVCVAAAAAG